MGRNVSETIVQLDFQETNEETEQADRRAITEAMKITQTGRSSKCSTPRLDQNRKAFFTGPKAARVNLQPWPSATNLLRLAVNQHQQQPAAADVNAPCVKKADKDTDSQSSGRRGSAAAATPAKRRPPFISVSRHDPSQEDEENTEEEEAEGEENDDEKEAEEEDEEEEEIVLASETHSGAFINSAFSQEFITAPRDGSSSACQCDYETSHRPEDHSDLCQFQCHHNEMCQHQEYVNESPQSDLSQTTPRRRLNSCPRLLVRCQSSTGSRRKWIRWRRSQADNDEDQDSSARRKTIDCLPSARMIMPQTSSSPNLKSWPLSSQSSVISQQLDTHCPLETKDPCCDQLDSSSKTSDTR